MNCAYDRILAEVAEDVFASMAFVLPAETDDRPDAEKAGEHVQVDFSGPFAGSLLLSVSQDLTPVLAANMLGLEDSGAASSAQRHDALCELANVICGNVLPLVATPRDVFHIRQPRRLPPAEAARLGRCHDSEAHAELSLEGGRAELTLFVHCVAPAGCPSAGDRQA